MGWIQLDPEVYRLLFWALGHASQQINVAAMVSVWYLLAGLTVGGVVPTSPFHSRRSPTS